MKQSILVLLTAASALHAMAAIAAERPLKGPEIEALIKGNTAVGQSDKGEWKQFFEKSGDTAYSRGGEQPSHGSWEIRGDKFCSQWPPNDRWSCYDVTGDFEAIPKTITWIAGSTTYPAAMQDGNRM